MQRSRRRSEAAVRPSWRRSAGFSLIELLLVISIMAVLVGLVLPDSNPAIHDQLLSAARIMAADLAYARSLAVTYSSPYRITFDFDENRYTLESSEGRDLPATPFSSPLDTEKQHVVDLDELPNVGSGVQLVAAARGADLATPVKEVEFGALGETTQSDPTRIWLGAGEGEVRRYMPLDINPVTGLTTIGDYSAVGPPRSLIDGPPLAMAQ